MAGICFFFENKNVDIFSGCRHSLDAWNYALLAGGGITDVAIINHTDLHLTFNRQFNFTIYPHVSAFNSAVYDQTVTYIGAENEFTNVTSIWDFDHNTDWYMFGPAHGHTKHESGVSIPGGVFHSVHAASVVMAHRYKVLG